MITEDGPATNPTLLIELGLPDTREAAWRTFLDRYQSSLYRWCRRWNLQHADAEEVSSRVLTNLARALPTFRYDPAQRFRAWLKTVVDNAVRNYLREAARRPGGKGSGDDQVLKRLESLEVDVAIHPLVEELNEDLERESQAAHLIATLVRQRVAPHTWEAYWSTVIQGEPVQEVADRLGMSLATVYVARSRVGKMLRAEARRLGVEV
jgi:RNA polymerase sigma-70 factor (ECF subfamily)